MPEQNQKPKKQVLISQNWDEVIRIAKAAGWSRMTIVLKDGEPTDIEPLTPHIKLGTKQVDEEIDRFRAIGTAD